MSHGGGALTENFGDGDVWRHGLHFQIADPWTLYVLLSLNDPFFE